MPEPNARPKPRTPEQAVCLQCGLCCDGTMFGFVWLTDDEKRSLAGMFEIVETEQRARFRQPCPYSHECACTAYDARPRACRKFSCKTLQQLSQGVIDRSTALARIGAVRQALEDLRPLMLPGETLWTVRRRRAERLAETGRMDADEGTLLLRSVALDLLLERHFRTDDSRLFGSDEA
jgi:hypothetical protein